MAYYINLGGSWHPVTNLTEENAVTTIPPAGIHPAVQDHGGFHLGEVPPAGVAPGNTRPVRSVNFDFPLELKVNSRHEIYKDTEPAYSIQVRVCQPQGSQFLVNAQILE